jgi:pimeloyl-ACP methyl ester carboxylesterase
VELTENEALIPDAPHQHLKEQTFDARGVVINYAVGPSSGPPLLLLHGITERWQTFLPLMPHLAQTWQLYALDLRGHGQSGRVKNSYRVSDYAQDLILFLESEVSQPAVILGHSVGAWVAIYVAANKPKQVRAIILVDPPLHLQHTPLQDIPGGPYQAFAKILELIRSNPSWQAIEKGLAMYFPEGNSEARRARARVLSQLDPGALAMWLENQHMAGLDADALLQRIECPALLLQGNPQLGAALFDKDVTHALTLLRRGVSMCVPEGGHMLHQSHPETVLNCIEQFFSEQKYGQY